MSPHRAFILILILILLPHPHSFAEDGLFPVFPSGYLTLEDEDRSVYASSGGNTYLGRVDENGDFIVLGRRPNTSAFGQIFENGNVMILYSNPDE